MSASPLRASVVIPTRNRCDLLEAALGCLARQAIPREWWEVVVVDDGSEDQTPSVCQAEYPIPVIYERLSPRQGFCPARPRNQGLQRARGEMVLFLDADMLVGPGWVAAHLEAHGHTPAPRVVIGYTLGYQMTPEQRRTGRLRLPPPLTLVDHVSGFHLRDEWRDPREAIYAGSDDLRRHPAPWQYCWTNNLSVPRVDALEVGGFDEAFQGWGGEDIEFGYRLHTRGSEFHVARSAFGLHYPHPVGRAGEREAQLARNRRRLIEKHPHARLELWLWAGSDGMWAWERLSHTGWNELPGSSAPRSGESALAKSLRARYLPAGPLLWCGTGPALDAAGLSAWCNPFASAATPLDPRVKPLIGAFTPWDDHRFAGAMVWDYWRWLPESLFKGLVRECVRTSGRVLLVDGGGGPSSHGAFRLNCPAVVEAALGSLGPGYRWRRVADGNFTAYLVLSNEGLDAVSTSQFQAATARTVLLRATLAATRNSAKAVQFVESEENP